MEVINARSPYFIEVDYLGQTSSKLELFIWHKGETEPTVPTYTVSKIAPSPSQRKNVYNIAPFIKENIDIVAPILITTFDHENNNNWCYCKVKVYALGHSSFPVSTTTYIGLNGYTYYMKGYNSVNGDEIQVLVNTEIKRYYSPFNGSDSDQTYFNLLIQDTTPDETIQLRYYDNNEVLVETIVLLSDNNYLYKIPYIESYVGLSSGGSVQIYNTSDDVEIARIYSEPLCEPKYTPVLCSFINSFGGWGFITFFKAKSESYETKSKEFNLLPDNVDYNTFRGQTQKFNFESKKSVKVNTGWVDENYSTLLEQLFNSETILLTVLSDQFPVKLKSSSFQIKTHLKDKVINYELDFEYNFNQINNVQ